MITILPADKAFLESVAAPADTDAMVLRDGDGEIYGYALFRVTGDTVEILSVHTDEPLMTEGLIRSVLNAGDCRGAEIGLCRVEELAPVLRRLEFEAGENGYTVSIRQFLYGECRCQSLPKK